MEKIITLEAEIASDEKLVIEGAPEVEIDASKSITAEIAPDTYVLGSAGSFNTASSWVGAYVNELVQESIGTGGTLADALDLIRRDVMDSIELGVNQVITQVETSYVSNSTLATTLASEIEASRSSILNTVQTYADATSANATAVNALKSSLGGDASSAAVEAFIGNIAVTQVDQRGAWAATTDVLTASYNELQAEIEDTREVAIGEFTKWVEGTPPQLGMFKQENGVWYQYRGGTLGTYADGWVITPVSAALTEGTEAKTALEQFESATGVTLTQLQAQVDGEISSWFYNGVPSQINSPWSDWLALEESGSTKVQDQHVGDLYYDLTNEVAYRFAKNTSTGIYGWGIVSDDIIISALSKASTAQDTADGKITTYAGTIVPSGKTVNGTTISVEEGDIWIPEADVTSGSTTYSAKEVYVYRNGVWSKSTKYTDDTAANRNKQVFRENYSVGGPTGANEGDLWFVTDYYYTGVSGTASSTTKSEYGILTKEYVNGAWVNVAVEDRGNYAGISWAGYASSLLTGPNGEITGWQYSDGGTLGGESTSEFKISADKFKVASGTSSAVPFSIDTTTGLAKFNGTVSFTNVTDAPPIPDSTSDLINNSGYTTLSAVAAQGYVLPAGVANAINTNTTTINGAKITTGSISADKISSYNLTSTNATFENGIITNAKIANAAIDNSKIGDLSVSTLKIQDEAVVVPRSASGRYSCTIYYTPNVSHAVTVLGEWVQGAGRDGTLTKIAINGVDVRGELPRAGTLCSMFYNTYFYAGTPYVITLYTVQNTGDMSCRMLMLGTKK